MLADLDEYYYAVMDAEKRKKEKEDEHEGDFSQDKYQEV